jgi:hypothetical protein
MARRWHSYYWLFLKELGTECYATWRWELAASAITILFYYASDRSDFDLRRGLRATFYTLAVFVIWHAIGIPWLLYKKERVEHLTWPWGVFGFVCALGTLLLVVYGALWFYTMQPKVNLSKIPDGRDRRIVELETQVKALTPFQEPEDSLRRRTISLSNDLDHYIEERWANRPEPAYPDPKEPNPSEERKKAIQRTAKWDQETLNHYNDHFKDKWIGIVKEYEGKGVKVGTLVNDAEQNHPVQRTFFPFAPIAEDGFCQFAQTRFRELAYHVDGRDNRIDLH